MIRVSNLRHDGRPASIIVRNYDNAVVNVPENVVKKVKDKLPNESGQFRIKYKNSIPKEYAKSVIYERII